MSRWSKDQTRTLIKFYEKYPVLYNPNYPTNYNKISRKDAFEAIKKNMLPVFPTLNINALKDKLKAIKSNYAKEKKRHIEWLQTNQNNSTEVYVPYLWCYESLKFLDSQEDDTDEESTVNLTIKSKNDLNDDTQMCDTDSVESLDSNLDNFKDAAFSAMEWAQRMTDDYKSKSVAAEEVFCNYICQELKKIESQNAKEDLQWEILTLIRRQIVQQRNEKR